MFEENRQETEELLADALMEHYLGMRERLGAHDADRYLECLGEPIGANIRRAVEVAKRLSREQNAAGRV